MLTLSHRIMKYPDGWNKMGNLQKGLITMLQFSTLLWQMQPSEEAKLGSLGLNISLSASRPTFVCLMGREWSSQRWLYTDHNDNEVPLNTTSESVTLILPRCLDISILDFSDTCCLSMECEVRCKHVCSLWKHLRFT